MAAKKATPVARKSVPTPRESVEIGDVSTAPDDWEWDSIAAESATRVQFDTIGDVFIGQYIGTDHIEPDNGDDPFDLFSFRGRDEQVYAINHSYKLVQAMEKVDAGDWVRITYVKDIPTKRGLNPMKDFTVDVRR